MWKDIGQREKDAEVCRKIIQQRNCVGITCLTCPFTLKRNEVICPIHRTSDGNVGIAKKMLSEIEKIEDGVLKEFKAGHWYRRKEKYINRKPKDEWEFAYDGKPWKCFSVRDGNQVVFEGITRSTGGDGSWAYTAKYFEEVEVNAVLPGLPVKEFKVGSYYRWVGPADYKNNWNINMEEWKDGKARKCVKCASAAPAIDRYTFENIEGKWYYKECLRYFEEVANPSAVSPADAAYLCANLSSCEIQGRIVDVSGNGHASLSFFSYHTENQCSDKEARRKRLLRDL